MAQYTFNQIATILNQIVKDATGQNANLTAPRNTKEFVAAAELAMSNGMDPIMNSISQMVARTVFAVRPYRADTRLIDMDSLSYGNMVRKITPEFVDGAENQPMFNDQPADGQSTDQYTIKRPKALELHFTGFNQYEVQAPTVFVDQLKTAFSGPDQLSEFMSAQMVAVNNEIESQREALARNTLANFIGAKLAIGGDNVRHLLTEYNAATGLSLTATTVYQPGNFEGFIKWLYAYIEDLSNMMENRSVMYHEGITGHVIMRHTPKSMQRLHLFSRAMAEIKTMAMSGIYHDTLLQMDGVTASVDFWQSAADRMAVNVDASYTAPDGTITNGVGANTAVLGILWDRDAMGSNIHLESVDVTPRNAKGRYYNTYYHYAKRYWNDVTENAVVLCLD